MVERQARLEAYAIEGAVVAGKGIPIDPAAGCIGSSSVYVVAPVVAGDLAPVGEGPEGGAVVQMPFVVEVDSLAIVQKVIVWCRVVGLAGAVVVENMPR